MGWICDHKSFTFIYGYKRIQYSTIQYKNQPIKQTAVLRGETVGLFSELYHPEESHATQDLYQPCNTLEIKEGSSLNAQRACLRPGSSLCVTPMGKLGPEDKSKNEALLQTSSLSHVICLLFTLQF